MASAVAVASETAVPSAGTMAIPPPARAETGDDELVAAVQVCDHLRGRGVRVLAADLRDVRCHLRLLDPQRPLHHGA